MAVSPALDGDGPFWKGTLSKKLHMRAQTSHQGVGVETAGMDDPLEIRLQEDKKMWGTTWATMDGKRNNRDLLSHNDTNRLVDVNYF